MLWLLNQTLRKFWENAFLMILGQNRAILGLKKKVCPLETCIQILFVTDLLIPVDGQIQVDIFRHTNFSIWFLRTKVMPVLVKNCIKIINFGVLRSNMTNSSNCQAQGQTKT